MLILGSRESDMKDTVQFTVNVTGDTSEQKFEGLFEVKTKLSHREVLKEDEIRRSVLGVNPADAGSYAGSIATAISFLSVRVTRSPDWFKASSNGLDLEDENILVEVNNAAMAAIAKERKAHSDAAEEAQKVLKAKAKEQE
jgi:phenylalanyl-tRNA synthetase beta subunit